MIRNYCDGCGKEREKHEELDGWVYAEGSQHGDMEGLDYCPECWEKVMQMFRERVN